ncbi:mitochondrial substrate carrier family protein [Striga hermonthica]|uniref:Mitochondrial substrate carrier family protein n=1 Tax=Striga hermonthica TaxID=68872 RepID=A0A9N7MWP2_STRHE|nr:mitochondrial substrate carrier family protein [Striga hermonthica]
MSWLAIHLSRISGNLPWISRIALILKNSDFEQLNVKNKKMMSGQDAVFYGEEVVEHVSSVKEIGEENAVDAENVGENELQKLAKGILSVPLSDFKRLREGHHEESKSVSVHDFLKYTEAEGKRFFQELDRDGDGKVSLEDLEIAMEKRKLPKIYARDFLRDMGASFFNPELPEVMSKLPQYGVRALYRGSIPAIVGPFSRIHAIILRHLSGDGNENSMRGIELKIASRFIRKCGPSYCRDMTGRWCRWLFLWHCRHYLPGDTVLRCWDGPICRVQEGCPAAYRSRAAALGNGGCRGSVWRPNCRLNNPNRRPVGLFKGAVPRFFWVTPLGAMNFSGYELLRKAMG